MGFLKNVCQFKIVDGNQNPGRCIRPFDPFFLLRRRQWGEFIKIAGLGEMEDWFIIADFLRIHHKVMVFCKELGLVR